MKETDKFSTRKTAALLIALTILLGLLIGCTNVGVNTPHISLPPYENLTSQGDEAQSNTVWDESGFYTTDIDYQTGPAVDISECPTYGGAPYVSLSEKPYFTEADIKTEAFEYYSPLDELGRCGVTYACVCIETMPTEARESISQVKPSGWLNKKYDFVDGGYLYNRCHLIGFQLTAENANNLNLITGTRYLNIEGMLPFENMVADYVKETENHVMYRVTPLYEGDNLVASGVVMEGWSVEDNGDGICFNVYCFNVQPGVEIDYATGDNWIAGERENSSAASKENVNGYVLNTKTKKFHLPTCTGAADISDTNRQDYSGSREGIIQEGYEPCGRCKP